MKNVMENSLKSSYCQKVMNFFDHTLKFAQFSPEFDRFV